MHRFKIKHFANLPTSDLPGYTRMVEAYVDTDSEKWGERFVGSINEIINRGEPENESHVLVNERWVEADSAYLACRRYIKWLESGEGQLMDVEGGC